MTVHSGEARLCVTVGTLVLAVEIYSNPFTPSMTWSWYVKDWGQEGQSNNDVRGDGPTWAVAYRKALRACDARWAIRKRTVRERATVDKRGRRATP